MSIVKPIEARGHQRPRLPRVAIVALVLAFAAPSWAVPTIDFFVTPGTGVVSHAAGNNPMFGVNIDVFAVQGSGTPAGPAAPLICDQCTLTFSTGPLLFTTPSSWVFAAGPGFISVSGSVDTTGDGDGDTPGASLLSGFFVGPILTIDFLPGTGAASLTIATFFDIKNPFLTAIYGLPAVPWAGTLNLTWAGVGVPELGSGFVGVPQSGLVSNIFLVPEPTTLVLFGTGLIGVLGWTRRRVTPRS